MKVTVILISLSLAFFVGVNGALYDSLYQYLLSQKIPPTIPMMDTNTPVIVRFNMYLIELLYLNTEEMSINTLTWISYKWRDARFSWDPAIYGVTEIRLSDNLMWKPDITLNDGETIKSNEDYNVVVTYEGEMMYIFPAQFRSRCTVASNDTNPIFECKMKFGSWAYDGAKLDLQTAYDLDSVDLSEYQNSSLWNLTNTTVLRAVQYYSCCPEPYPDITYTLKLRSI